MRIVTSIFAILIAGATLTGCNTTSEEDFRLAQIAIAESPSLRAEVMKSCVEDMRRTPRMKQAEVAKFLKVNVSQLPQVACRRMLNAFAKGRISRADVNSATADEQKLLRILQGR